MSTRKLTDRSTAQRPPVLSDVIAGTLEDAIIAGQLRPHRRLIELDLATAHGVSRAPVREALRALERDGLVAKTTQGYEVAEVSAQEARDVFEILAHLEELYTRKAAPHLGSGIAVLRAVLTDMKGAVKADDVALYYRLNIRFHQTISDACPNRPLVALLSSLGKRTLRLRRLAMSIPGRMPVSLVEHQRIHAALRDGDAAAAGLLARESAVAAYAALESLLRSDLL